MQAAMLGLFQTLSGATSVITFHCLRFDVVWNGAVTLEMEAGDDPCRPQPEPSMIPAASI